MITLYGIRNCDTCRKALKWLQSGDIDHNYVDIRETGLSAELLERWQDSTPWDRLVNRRSTTWRNIPAHERENLNADTARELILKYPTVMKRPVLDLGDNIVLGFDATAYSELKPGNE